MWGHWTFYLLWLAVQGKAQLVVIVHDVDPIELIVWLPALCRTSETHTQKVHKKCGGCSPGVEIDRRGVVSRLLSLSTCQRRNSNRSLFLGLKTKGGIQGHDQWSVRIMKCFLYEPRICPPAAGSVDCYGTARFSSGLLVYIIFWGRNIILSSSYCPSCFSLLVPVRSHFSVKPDEAEFVLMQIVDVVVWELLLFRFSLWVAGCTEHVCQALLALFRFRSHAVLLYFWRLCAYPKHLFIACKRVSLEPLHNIFLFESELVILNDNWIIEN